MKCFTLTKEDPCHKYLDDGPRIMNLHLHGTTQLMGVMDIYWRQTEIFYLEDLEFSLAQMEKLLSVNTY